MLVWSGLDACHSDTTFCRYSIWSWIVGYALSLFSLSLLWKFSFFLMVYHQEHMLEKSFRLVYYCNIFTLLFYDAQYCNTKFNPYSFCLYTNPWSELSSVLMSCSSTSPCSFSYSWPVNLWNSCRHWYNWWCKNPIFFLWFTLF